MLPYLLLLVLTLWMAMVRMRPSAALATPRLGPAWPAFFVLIALMIGFRHEVGGDWGAYLTAVDDLKGESLDAVLGYGDLAYQLLNWLGANVGGGVYFVNLVCGALFCWGLVAFCRSQPRPWLALLVAIPFLVMVVAMGTSRQGVAIGLAMLAFTKLQTGSINRFIFWVALAALFHKSAVILIPFAVFVASRYGFLNLIGVAVSAALLFVLLLLEKIDYFRMGYIEAEYASPGAAIRIVMNVVPAALLLVCKKRFTLDPKTRNFWISMAWGALLLAVILLVSPSSAAVDRVALYWIPLQLLIFSRVPDAFGVPGRRNPLWVSLVAAYCAMVMLVWLLFANHANAWLPYRFYPWEALWL
jgi:hypothetical protein